MVDVYEVGRCKVSGHWKTHKLKLLVIAMPAENARLMLRQNGLLAPDYRFVRVRKQLDNMLPTKTKNIGFMNGSLFALAEHNPAGFLRHPAPEIYAAPAAGGK